MIYEAIWATHTVNLQKLVNEAIKDYEKKGYYLKKDNPAIILKPSNELIMIKEMYFEKELGKGKQGA